MVRTACLVTSRPVTSHPVTSRPVTSRVVAACLVAVLARPLAVAAQPTPVETVLNTLGPGTGAAPQGGMVADPAGNLYGTTVFGATVPNSGGVFMLTPPAAGQAGYASRAIYTFTSSDDGSSPMGRLVIDAQGVLYGVTAAGGTYNAGTIYTLTPPSAGQSSWTHRVLYSFTGGLDGEDPNQTLLLSPAGALYGVANAGGKHRDGVIFRLSPPAAGQSAWTLRVLHDFACAQVGNGCHPSGPLLQAHGVFYGVQQTTFGSSGAVYQLAPSPSNAAAWDFAQLYVFTTSADGVAPSGSLAPGRSGDLFGTTPYGGSAAGGTAFRLAPPIAGQTTWSHTVIHDFGTPDGYFPNSGVVIGGNGALFGTTASGGFYGYGGTVFALKPPASGATLWSETLYSFNQAIADQGSTPQGALLLGNHTVIGTCLYGGATRSGLVFSIAE